ncbi:MAG TPA: patatin-like phospholipase family protein, partial [Segetibacter sp.]|nr:patatin-like phospholipase family protein [Segetibacter sp.]
MKENTTTTTNNNTISVESFTEHPEVLACIKRLESEFGKGGERLLVSDVLDTEGHQYVNLVQKGGGVLGVALVGYTYILEQMGIRFIRLAGTSAGAINTALMTVIGSEVEINDNGGGKIKNIKGNKKISKSKEVLQAICNLNFFDLVDGHPAARLIIKNFITNKDFTLRVNKWIIGIVITLIALPALDFICLGLQYHFQWVSYFTKGFFVLTGFFILLLILVIFYASYLIKRLKDSGFGINPGDFFYDWIKKRMLENHVESVSDLITVASTPVPDLYLRSPNDLGTSGLEGDVTFITSEIVTKNKVEFPKMWSLFKKDKDELQPAGFVRASMSIPIFFESYFINEIPCTDQQIKDQWNETFGEQDPPSTARFVDGGILSNFPINLFYNSKADKPRLPSFGIDLDDEKDAEEVSENGNKQNRKETKTGGKTDTTDEGKNAESWSIGGYLYRMFNTVRFYYDKDFLIKNNFFQKGIGVIPLKGFGWLNFFLDNE